MAIFLDAKNRCLKDRSCFLKVRARPSALGHFALEDAAVGANEEDPGTCRRVDDAAFASERANAIHFIQYVIDEEGRRVKRPLFVLFLGIFDQEESS